MALSSVAALLTVSQSAFAQLNVGRYGVQPGLEPLYLQYQLSGQDLSQMRGISGCVIGFGLSCNKTGSVLNQLLESNNRASYQDLLMRAAGGPENFRNFASFYGNNPNLPQVPYASFWQNDSPSIMDGYRYLLGGPLSRSPVEGLGLVTKNFYWAPLSGADDSLSLRSGLLDLKYSFGRTLLEEVSKIPNVEQQIQSMGLSPEMTNFYLANLSRGLRALNTGDETQIQHSILNLLSSPYSPNGGQFQRPNIGILNLDQAYTEGPPGDAFVSRSVLLNPDVGSLNMPGDLGSIDIPESFGEVVSTPEGAGHGFPGWLLGAPAGLALLLLLLTSGGGDSSSSEAPVLLAGTSDLSQQPSPSGGGLTPNGGSLTPNGNGSPQGQVIEMPGTPTVINPSPNTESTKVLEPSLVKSLVLIIVVLWILTHKQRRMQTRS
ncbi:MAG: hypothetical protein DSM106950_30295 [Stigonema ocellatum SAG 48.90 = DSM 106950]|nr:hypothetical protein [Stigonema ocellatum SAG 48.90 = DSM 106950]